MWSFFHKLGSPPWLFQISGRILRWLLPATLVALAVGIDLGAAVYRPGFSPGQQLSHHLYPRACGRGRAGGLLRDGDSGRDQPDLENEDGRHRHAGRGAGGCGAHVYRAVTGSIWGKPTWGTWWVWDARITSMLILLFLYLGVMALYEAYDNKAAAARACAVLALVGTVNIPIIYKSVDWWYSLHQPASIKFTGEHDRSEHALSAAAVHRVLLRCCSPVRCLPTCESPFSTASGARAGCSAWRARAADVLRQLAAALTMDGHGAYVWSAYALSLLVLVYDVSAPLRRQRRLLRELRGEARRNAGSVVAQ
jgi:heme exporter protein C